jgi:hypothetical protein
MSFLKRITQKLLRSGFKTKPKYKFCSAVRIKNTFETRSLGLADKTGIVFGFTVPSSSLVENVIGPKHLDYAVNVYFDDIEKGYWFTENLLEKTID